MVDFFFFKKDQQAAVDTLPRYIPKTGGVVDKLLFRYVFHLFVVPGLACSFLLTYNAGFVSVRIST